MQRSRILKQAALAGFLALAYLALGGGGRATAQVIDCTNGSLGPNMTIVIYNNSVNFNIYPVLFAGAPSATDQWMQACFKIPANQIQPTDNFPYPRASQYRMYVNCCAPGENGIHAERFGDDQAAVLFTVGCQHQSDGNRPIHRLVARRRHQRLPGSEHREHEAANDTSKPLGRRHQPKRGASRRTTRRPAAPDAPCISLSRLAR